MTEPVLFTHYSMNFNLLLVSLRKHSNPHILQYFLVEEACALPLKHKCRDANLLLVKPSRKNATNLPLV
jgi:hypothetical protein